MQSLRHRGLMEPLLGVANRCIFASFTPTALLKSKCPYDLQVEIYEISTWEIQRYSFSLSQEGLFLYTQKLKYI